MHIFRNIDPDSLSEACDWMDRYENDSVDEAAFDAWSRNPKNVEAWIAVNQFESLFEVKKLLDDYSKSANQNAYRLEGQVEHPLNNDDKQPKGESAPQALNRRALIWSLSSAAAVGVLGIGALVATAREVAETRVGERKIIDLPGGNQLDLNTDTRVSWRADEQTRKVWLERGEVVLVAVNSTEPFVVKNGSALMLVNSGLCNLRKAQGAMAVTVVQGHVSFRTARQPAQTVDAGNVLRWDGNRQSLRMATAREINNIALWRRGRVSFEGMTLGDAVEEYNRYLPQKIVVDPDLRPMRIVAVGSWRTDDPTDFLHALSTSFGVKIVRGVESIRVTK